MGSRYGVKIRKRRDEIIARKSSSYACLKCGKKGVKRVSFALWECGSCRAKFAGGAYSPETMVGAAARRTIRGLTQGANKQQD